MPKSYQNNDIYESGDSFVNKEVTYDKRTADIISFIGRKLYTDNKIDSRSSVSTIKYLISEYSDDVISMCEYGLGIAKMTDAINDVDGFDYGLQHDIVGGLYKGWPKLDTNLKVDSGTVLEVDSRFWSETIVPISNGLDIGQTASVRIVVYYGLNSIKYDTDYFSNNRSVGNLIVENWGGIHGRLTSISLFYDLLRREFEEDFDRTKSRLLLAGNLDKFTLYYADNVAGSGFEDKIRSEASTGTVENIRKIVEGDLDEELPD